VSLAINTPRGQESVLDELAAAGMVCRRFPGVSYQSFKKRDEYADCPIDGLFCWDGMVQRLVETKCREASLDTFTRVWNWEWLITASKLEEMGRICRLLRTEGAGMLYLKGSGVVLLKRLFDCDGRQLFGWPVRETATPETCNGGLAVRRNAFVSMRGAVQIGPEKNFDFPVDTPANPS
jgi:hypothetical protein